MPEFNKGGQFK